MKSFSLVIGTWCKFLSHPSSPGHIWDVLFQNLLGFWNNDSSCNPYVLWSGMKFWEIVSSWFLWKEVLNTSSTEWTALEQMSVTFVPTLLLLWRFMWTARECSFNHVEESQIGFWIELDFPKIEYLLCCLWVNIFCFLSFGQRN